MGYSFKDASLSRYGFVRYYWICIKHFGKQVWRSWRTEALSSLGVTALVFLISWRRHDSSALSSFEIAVVANLCWLAVFALVHLIRSPWLMHRDPTILDTAVN